VEMNCCSVIHAVTRLCAYRCMVGSIINVVCINCRVFLYRSAHSVKYCCEVQRGCSSSVEVLWACDGVEGTRSFATFGCEIMDAHYVAWLSVAGRPVIISLRILLFVLTDLYFFLFLLNRLFRKFCFPVLV
jgi:hypothetical protein